LHPDQIDQGCIGRIFSGDPAVVIGTCLLLTAVWWGAWFAYRSWIRRAPKSSPALALTPLAVYALAAAYFAWRSWLHPYPDF
jgi:hypothetical protein